MKEDTIVKEANELITTRDFIVYSIGLCCASICSNLPTEDVGAELNRQHPTGISSRWTLAQEKFRTGEDNPHPCERYPSTHKHYLFTC